MKNRLSSYIIVLFFYAIGSITALNPVSAKAETYCLSTDLCFTIPEDFLLIDKALSDDIANLMKKQFPGMNIGFYAGLYETFYQNELTRAERAYIGLKETGNIFLVFLKMSYQQKKSFPKEIFTKGPWPSEDVDKDRLQRSIAEGMKKSKGLSYGGMSVDFLQMNCSKKYMLIKRTTDLTEARIDQAKKTGIPVGQPGKVCTDFVAVKFGHEDALFIMYFADSTERPENYLNIFENMLSNSTN